MCKILQEFRKEIEAYCFKNKLNIGKVFSSPKSYNNDLVLIQYHDPSKGAEGLRDETPAPIVLKIYRVGGGLEFEQTEYTKKYLS